MTVVGTTSGEVEEELDSNTIGIIGIMYIYINSLESLTLVLT